MSHGIIPFCTYSITLQLKLKENADMNKSNSLYATVFNGLNSLLTNCDGQTSFIRLCSMSYANISVTLRLLENTSPLN